MIRTVVRIALASFIALLVTVTGGTTAWAHNRLISAHPYHGAELSTLPRSVTLVFAEDLDPSTELTITGPDGSAASGKPIVIAKGVSAPITSQNPGTYTVRYKTVSLDGDPISGTMQFTVTAGGNAAPPPPSPAASPTTDATNNTAAAPQTPSSSMNAWPWITGGILLLASGSCIYLFRRREIGASPTHR